MIETEREVLHHALGCLQLISGAAACTDTYVSSDAGRRVLQGHLPGKNETTLNTFWAEKAGTMESVAILSKATPRGGSKEPLTKKDTVLFTMSHASPSTSPFCHYIPKALLLPSPHLLMRTLSKPQLKALSPTPSPVHSLLLSKPSVPQPNCGCESDGICFMSSSQ